MKQKPTKELVKSKWGGEKKTDMPVKHGMGTLTGSKQGVLTSTFSSY